MIAIRFGTAVRLLFTSVIGVAACAHRSRPINAPLLETPEVYASRYIISGPEISRAHMLTAYELVARLRAEFLESYRNRNAKGLALPPTVYIDGLVVGDVTALRDIPTRIITEIRFVPPHDATTYHGQADRAGDIMVYTCRQCSRRSDPR
jgi:hypothetical protein